jgi:hypothetical protein
MSGHYGVMENVMDLELDLFLPHLAQNRFTQDMWAFIVSQCGAYIIDCKECVSRNGAANVQIRTAGQSA